MYSISSFHHLNLVGKKGKSYLYSTTFNYQLLWFWYMFGKSLQTVHCKPPKVWRKNLSFWEIRFSFLPWYQNDLPHVWMVMPRSCTHSGHCAHYAPLWSDDPTWFSGDSQSCPSIHYFLRGQLCISNLGQKEEVAGTHEVTLHRDCSKMLHRPMSAPPGSPRTRPQCFHSCQAPPNSLCTSAAAMHFSFGISSSGSWSWWQPMASLCGSSQAGCCRWEAAQWLWKRREPQVWTLSWYRLGSASVEVHISEQGHPEAGWMECCRLYFSSWSMAQAWEKTNKLEINNKAWNLVRELKWLFAFKC